MLSFNNILIIIIIALLGYGSAIGSISKDRWDDLYPSDDIKYLIRLENGDLITGFITEMVNDKEYGEGIKVVTAIGTAKIYANQIVEIKVFEDSYRHRHRVFLLPTAEPIGDDHFLGSFEVLFAYAGFGLFDIISITAGRSFVPGIAAGEQVSLINAKATLMEMPLEGNAKKLSLAFGWNLAWINHNNKFSHLYTVATAELSKTLITGAMFYKIGSRDYYRLNFGPNFLDLNYLDGNFGLAFGMDTKLSQRHGINVIAEIWNSDVVNAANTGVLIGIRHSNTAFAADFGIAFFTSPFAAPFVSFAWTPFN